MALIKCPECGQDVSDKAEICPHCGIKIAGNVNVVPQEEPTVQPVAPQGDKPKGKKSKKVLIASFCVALAIVGAGYYFYNDSQSAKEQEDYEYAMLSDDPMVLQSYLTRYGDAPQAHRDSVNVRLSLLSQEDTDWTNAVTSGTKSALEEYVRTHPDSPHKGEASNKIDSIDFAIASRKNDVAAYTLYLQQHPDGKYAGQAQDFLDDKKQTEVTPEEEAAAKGTFRRFFQSVNAHDEGRLLETVADGLTQFLDRYNAVPGDVVTFMNKLYKDDVKNLNWHILDGAKMEKVKKDDGTYSVKAEFPAELKIDRTDPSKEKYRKFIVTGEVSSDGKITRLTMKKIENQE